jgi:hypothetical protein
LIGVGGRDVALVSPPEQRNCLSRRGASDHRGEARKQPRVRLDLPVVAEQARRHHRSRPHAFKDARQGEHGLAAGQLDVGVHEQDVPPGDLPEGRVHARRVPGVAAHLADDQAGVFARCRPEELRRPVAGGVVNDDDRRLQILGSGELSGEKATEVALGVVGDERDGEAGRPAQSRNGLNSRNSRMRRDRPGACR